MNLRPYRNIIKVFKFIVIVSILTLGFYANSWHIIRTDKFENFDKLAQSQVLGRIIKAEKDGVFSKSGFTGWVNNDSIKSRSELYCYQYDVYLNEKDVNVDQFTVYRSQIGGQGIMFATLDKISPFNNKINFLIFQFLTAFSLALILFFFLFWVEKIFGPITSFFTFICIVLSPWLTMMGRNIYWIISVFYLAFVVFNLMLQKEKENQITTPALKFVLLTAILVFLKLFFTGFEYITTYLIMCTIPFFFYSFWGNWSILKLSKRIIHLVIGTTSAMLIYSVILINQIALLKGNYLYGLKFLIHRFILRSQGTTHTTNNRILKSLDASILDVIYSYLRMLSFNFDNWGFKYLIMNFIMLFIVFVICSIIIVLPKFNFDNSKNKNRNKALVFSTWLSLLAPLSWLIIFKSHSYIHLQYNRIVWYMPFCIMGFVLIGLTFQKMINNIGIKIKQTQMSKTSNYLRRNYSL